jgi:hypothetical protein
MGLPKPNFSVWGLVSETEVWHLATEITQLHGSYQIDCACVPGSNLEDIDAFLTLSDDGGLTMGVVVQSPVCGLCGNIARMR